jgi:BirA family biotin operon repressor/biotin-[acetyl-CoA-carboxylase] ligase
MQIIKLGATESTNLYLKGIIDGDFPQDFTVVVTDKQTKGKGQINAEWESEPSKNLTFSVLKRHSNFEIQHQFLITMCVSLAVSSILKDLGLPKIQIKWPNDILSGNSKICGILIENNIQGMLIKTSVIGIGLNVNQTTFSKTLKATSIKNLLKKEMELEFVLDKILNQLKHYLSNLSSLRYTDILNEYLGLLFKKGIVATFKEPDDELFTGIIEGVSTDGKLLVRVNDTIVKQYDLKEVKLLY